MRQCRERNFEGEAVILGCITFLLSGCFKVGPEFTRPPVSVSPIWLDASDPRVKTEAADYRNWWQAFNDPALDRLIERAYRENLSLRIAGVRVLQARAQLGIAAGELYPQTQQAVGSLQYNRLSDGPPQAAFIARTWRTGSPRSGPRPAGSSTSGEGSGGASNRPTPACSPRSRTTTTRWSPSRRTWPIPTSRSGPPKSASASPGRTWTIQEENLKIAEARFRYGTRHAAGRGAGPDGAPEHPGFHSGPGNAAAPGPGRPQRAAGPAAGRSGAICWKVRAEIPVSPPQVIVGIPADLLRRRPDIRSAELQAAAQCAQIGVAKADLYPAFSLTGNSGLPLDGCWGTSS